LAERTPEEQQMIVLTFVDVMASYLERFATSAGLEGVPAEEFVLALGERLARSESSSEEVPA
jgi:hypothetical protein